MHYRYAAGYVQCNAVIGPNTETTYNLGSVTCRRCMFSYLASQAPWARDFLDDLRKVDTAAKRSAGARGQGVPVAGATDTHTPVERLGRSLASLLSQERGAQEAVSEFLPQAEAPAGAVQVVMAYSGAAAEPVGVQPGQVAEQAGDRRQVSDKPGWDF